MNRTLRNGRVIRPQPDEMVLYQEIEAFDVRVGRMVPARLGGVVLLYDSTGNMSAPACWECRYLLDRVPRKRLTWLRRATLYESGTH